MTVFQHSYAALRESTGLDPDFIRRLMRSVTELKQRHTAKGERSELLFDDQALSALQQAAQLRAEKSPFKLIAERVAEQISPSLSLKLEPEPIQSTLIQPDRVAQEIAELQAQNTQLQQVHQLALAAQQERLAGLKQQLLLLTGGKDPGTVQQEREAEQARHLELAHAKTEIERRAQEQALKLTQAQEHVSQLKASLEKMRCEATHLIKDFQSQKLAARERSVQRLLLLDQVDQLAWAQGGHQRDLLNQLRELA